MHFIGNNLYNYIISYPYSNLTCNPVNGIKGQDMAPQSIYQCDQWPVTMK